MSILDRAQGCLVGLACGDALGTTLEFKQRGSFEPITDMVGGGPFNLVPGQWTDDTSMALCLAHSLVFKKGFDAVDQMNRYCNWYQHGYMSSNGVCFDIGITVAAALNRYLSSGNPLSGSTDERSSGNGSLMRLAPVALFYGYAADELLHYAALSSQTTHASAECIDSCRYFALLLAAALNAESKEQILATAYQASTPKLAAIVAGDYIHKPYSELTGSGYVIESLESALWCFYHGQSFQEAILLAANLGNDADTTAAICGQLAGAFYGYEAIPLHWREQLYAEPMIRQLAQDLLQG